MTMGQLAIGDKVTYQCVVLAHDRMITVHVQLLDLIPHSKLLPHYPVAYDQLLISCSNTV